jgi:hypothetical protein
MRDFNKLFVVALPRCATVSISQALGMMGVRIAHLGSINGQSRDSHHELKHLSRMAGQIDSQDWNLEILQHCRGLADYPVCCMSAIEQLDQRFPNSLFINVRRDRSVDRWLKSVEIQFVGFDLLLSDPNTTSQQRQLIQILRKFRKMTFGSEIFDADLYRAAYEQYQANIAGFFRHRDDLLEFSDLEQLNLDGFQRLAEFLGMAPVDYGGFPKSNAHSQLPHQAFARALREGRIRSQTGIQWSELVDAPESS